ncbi:MAG: MgtC/SapB family protein [Acidobacteria bacterium]|nr:MgtC/SapB family protein [Acidobacteriota bacterium]
MLWHQFAIRFGLALIFGALIGAERQWRQRMAGLRTNALVSAGAAMFVMMGGLIGGDGSQGRVAAYVVSGIGFLGGGVILKDGVNIRGINTAATLWCTAAVGSLSGLGAARFSLVGTVGIIAANILLRPVGKAINRDLILKDAEISYLFRMVAKAEREGHMRALLLHALGGQPLLLRSLESEDVEHTDKVAVRATLTSTGRQNLLLEQIVSRLSLEPGVSGVSWEIVAEHE